MKSLFAKKKIAISACLIVAAGLMVMVTFGVVKRTYVGPSHEEEKIVIEPPEVLEDEEEKIVIEPPEVLEDERKIMDEIFQREIEMATNIRQEAEKEHEAFIAEMNRIAREER